LVSAIANTSPAFVVILGDLVFDGSDPVHWQHFDYIIRALAKKQTPIFPLLGNHDYCSNNMHLIESHSCNNEAAWKEYSHRFPYRSSLSNGDVQTTWYSHIYGSASWEVRN
jgi:predicted MPP superfamily phosphohydrolase